MSKALVESFFPASFEWIHRSSSTQNENNSLLSLLLPVGGNYYITTVLAYLFDHWIFPDSIAERCPEVRVQVPMPLINTRLLPTIMNVNIDNNNEEQNNNNYYYSYMYYELRLPILFIAALMGIGIGLYGCVRFSASIRKRKNTNNDDDPRHQHQEQQQHNQPQQGKDNDDNAKEYAFTINSTNTTTNNTKFINVYLSLAFGSFGLMNVSAIFLHCLWAAPSSSSLSSSSLSSSSVLSTSSSSLTYPEVYPLLWICDTYMTGVSSICLLFTSLEQYSSSQRRRRQRLPSSVFHSWLLCQSVGVVCIGWFFWVHPSSVSSSSTNNYNYTLPLELWYLIPILLATIPLMSVMFLLKEDDDDHVNTTTTSTLTSRRWGRSLLITGSLISLIGISLDQWGCLLFLQHHNETTNNSGWWHSYDFWTASTFTFIGSDIAFIGIYHFFFHNQQQRHTTTPTQNYNPTTMNRTSKRKKES